jgi:hypothetical protein
MKIKIRKPNLENLNSEGIPKDFAEVRDYFNLALKEKSLPWIPRSTPITNQEIKEKWIPSLKTNISLIAELNGKAIGSATVFYDLKSSAYEYSNKRISGEFNSTADPQKNYPIIIKNLIKGTIKELNKQNKTAHCYVPVESPSKKAFESLGYLGKEEFLEHYKQGDLSGKVIRYEFP